MRTSESIVNIAEAFVKFQEEVVDPKLDASTDYITKTGKKINFKYASLPEILRIVRPVLSKNGIALIQEPCTDNNEVKIVTRLIHKSGEWIEFEALKMKAASSLAQEIGSAITYGRRYNISSVLGLGAEDDDDGNAATSGIENKKTEEPKNEEVQYVRTVNGEIQLRYPTYDDAAKFKTPMKWLNVSGFNAAQCKYVLSRQEYKDAFQAVQSKLETLQNKAVEQKFNQEMNKLAKDVQKDYKP